MTTRRLVVVTAAIAFILFSCINAPRDSIYDPNNPNRAYIVGIVCEPDSSPVDGAVITLSIDEQIIKADTTDDTGGYEIEDIIPDIYKLTVESPLYYDVWEQYPESLWAETYLDNYDIFLDTYVFEDDSIGTVIPYAFGAAYGSWSIVEDNGQPEKHSVPNVYKGEDSDTTEPAISLLQQTDITAFYFAAKLKVLSASGTDWQVGIVYRFQNPMNYYLLKIYADSIVALKVVDGAEVRIQGVAQIFSTDIWYSLAVEYDNTHMTIYLNNEWCIGATDGSIKQGQLGLWVSDSNTGTAASVFFDDVTVQLR